MQELIDFRVELASPFAHNRAASLGFRLLPLQFLCVLAIRNLRILKP
jgi:hypothetical protein